MSNQSTKSIITKSLSGLAVLIIVIFLFGFYSVSEGYTVVYQNPIKGELGITDGNSFDYALPTTKVENYKNMTTVSHETDKDGYYSTVDRPPLPISFADRYKATISFSARFVLPTEQKYLEKIQKDFRSYDNLVDNLYLKVLTDITKNVSEQIEGPVAMLGGRGEIQAKIEDYLKYGKIQTVKKTVKEEKIITNVAGGGKVIEDGTTTREIAVERIVPVLDSKGIPVRLNNPLDKYGVTVAQVTINSIIPHKDLLLVLTNRQNLIKEEQSLIQRRQNAITRKETEKQEGEANREKEKQLRLKDADAELIDKQKDVDIATKEAALVLVQEQQKLDVATKQRQTERQNALKAKDEATAIRQVGLAQASVLAANWKAKDNAAFYAEKEVEKLKAMKDIPPVQLPTNFIMGGGKSGNLEDYTNLMILEKLTKSKEVKK